MKETRWVPLPSSFTPKNRITREQLKWGSPVNTYGTYFADNADRRASVYVSPEDSQDVIYAPKNVKAYNDFIYDMRIAHNRNKLLDDWRNFNLASGWPVTRVFEGAINKK